MEEVVSDRLKDPLSFSYTKRGDSEGIKLREKDEGLWISSDGEMRTESYLKNGKMDGLSICYVDGKVYDETIYRDGKKHGRYVRYEDWRIEGNYENGLKEGTWIRTYLYFGRIIIDRYHRGLKDGICEIWSPEGVKTSSSKWQNGTFIEDLPL